MSAGSHDARNLAKVLALLKQEFAKKYDGRSHIQEVIPDSPTELIPIDQAHLDTLHDFARCNPIYHNSFSKIIMDIDCTVYEGDINTYWLDSIKHGSSCQPFYPTWILSAYISSLHAKNLGCRSLIDIGSGDGRIAYCGRMLGLDSYSIEIDEMLTELQSSIVKSTGIKFTPACSDATKYDYSTVSSGPATFFIGGLPQMGGDILAESVIGQISENDDLVQSAVFVLAGTDSKRMLSSNVGCHGWADLLERFNLKVLDTLMLPTIWTFDQDMGTPYIFSGFRAQ